MRWSRTVEEASLVRDVSCEGSSICTVRYSRCAWCEIAQVMFVGKSDGLTEFWDILKGVTYQRLTRRMMDNDFVENVVS
jgi:hypothetical protein